MSGTLKLDLALYREMAAFSSFGFDESTQELLRRGAALTEMLKQQPFRPLPSDVQVLVLYSGIQERITPKQISFYEYQVVPNLLITARSNRAKSLYQVANSSLPLRSSTLFSSRIAAAQALCDHGPLGVHAFHYFHITHSILYSCDATCTFHNLLFKSNGDGFSSFITHIG